MIEAFMKKKQKSYEIRNCVFAYKCEADWEKLEDTNKEKIRYCGECDREVHFCEDDKELTEAVRENFCVAFERVEKDRKFLLTGMLRSD
jgi:hypothetical protein